MPTLSDLSSVDFWKQAAEGAVVTGAATLAAELAVYHTDDIKKLGLTGLPWDEMGSVAVVAALLAVLTAVGKKNAPKVRSLFAGKGGTLPAVGISADEISAQLDGVAEEVQAEVVEATGKKNKKGSKGSAAKD